MTIDKVLNAITSAQQELAIAALRSPNSHDAFEYGRMVGMYAGLERALEVIMSTIKEEDEE
jgi:hypothetical protein